MIKKVKYILFTIVSIFMIAESIYAAGFGENDTIRSILHSLNEGNTFKLYQIRYDKDSKWYEFIDVVNNETSSRGIEGPYVLIGAYSENGSEGSSNTADDFKLQLTSDVVKKLNQLGISDSNIKYRLEEDGHTKSLSDKTKIKDLQYNRSESQKDEDKWVKISEALDPSILLVFATTLAAEDVNNDLVNFLKARFTDNKNKQITNDVDKKEHFFRMYEGTYLSIDSALSAGADVDNTLSLWSAGKNTELVKEYAEAAKVEDNLVIKESDMKEGESKLDTLKRLLTEKYSNADMRTRQLLYITFGLDIGIELSMSTDANGKMDKSMSLKGTTEQRDYNPLNNVLYQAVSLGISATACSSYGDSDYLSTAIRYLNDTEGSFLKTQFVNNSDEYIAKTLKLLYQMTQFKQPVYYSNSLSKSLKTDTLLPLTIGDLFDNDFLYGYTGTTASDGKQLTSKRLLKIPFLSDIIKNIKNSSSDENNSTSDQIPGIDAEKEEITDLTEFTSFALDQEDSERREYINQIFTSKKSYGPDETGLSKIYNDDSIISDRNCIFVMDSLGYKRSYVEAYINYLYIKRLKEDYTFRSRVNSNDIVFVDAFGNLVTSNNIMIMPAISNFTLMSYGRNTELTLFQSKAFIDAFSTWVEVDSEAYNALYNRFTYKYNSSSEKLDEFTEYEILRDFRLQRMSSNYYISILPKTIDRELTSSSVNVASSSYVTESVGNQTMILSGQSYIIGKVQNVVAYLKYYLESVVTGNLEAKGSDGAILKITNTAPKVQPILAYARNCFFTTMATLSGFKYQDMQSCVKKLLESYPTDVATLLVYRSVSAISNSLLKVAPSYIDVTYIDNEKVYLSIMQIAILILFFIGVLFALFNIIKSFTFKRFFVVIFVYIGTVLLVVNINSISNFISNKIVDLCLGKSKDSLVISSLIEGDADKKLDLDKIKTPDNSNSSIVLESRPLPILSFIKSVLNEDHELDLEEEVYNLNKENVLFTDPNQLVDRSLLDYYLNLSRYSKDVGVRSYINKNTQEVVIKYTRSPNVSVSNYYMTSDVIMELVTRKISSMCSNLKITPQSAVDNNKTFVDENANQTFGLSKEYLDRVSTIDDFIFNCGPSFDAESDITGLYEFMCKYYETLAASDSSDTVKMLMDGNRMFTNQALYNSNTEGLYNAYANKLGLSIDNIQDTLSCFSKFNTDSIVEDYSVIITNWGSEILMNSNSTLVYDAVVAANKEFKRSLEFLVPLSSTTSDKNILLFASINAALEFNRVMGYEPNSLSLNTVSNDTLLKLMLSGNEGIMYSAAKTSARYYYENSRNALQAIILLFTYVLFSMLCFVKHILMYVVLLVFIYSVMKNGIVSFNLEGFIGGFILYLIVNVSSILLIKIFVIIATVVKNPSLMAGLICLSSFVIIVVIFQLCKEFVDDATSGGFEFLRNAALGIYSSLASGANALLNNSMFKDVTMEGVKENVLSFAEERKLNIKTQTQDNIDRINRHYDNSLIDASLTTTQVYTGEVIDAEFVPVHETRKENQKLGIEIAPLQIEDFKIERE